MSSVTVSNVHLDSVGNNRIHLEASNVSIVRDGLRIVTANSISATVFDGTTNSSFGSTPGGTSIGSFRISLSNTPPNNSYIAADDVYPKTSYRGLYNAIGDIDGASKSITWNYTGGVSALSAAYGNGTFFFGGYSDFFLYTLDGINYVQGSYPLNTMGNLGVSAYGNGVFLTGGSGGKLMYSSTFSNWAVIVPVTTGETITALHYANGRWVAGTQDGKIYTSTSHTAGNWAFVHGNSTAGSFNDITYGNGLFVAASVNGVSTSNDGVTWTETLVIPFQAVEYGNGIFVAAGDYGTIYTSTNGTTWTNRTPTWVVDRIQYNSPALAYGNGNFLLINALAILNSPDGINWYFTKIRQTVLNFDTLISISYPKAVYGNGTFIVTTSSSSQYGRSTQTSADFYVPPHPISSPTDTVKYYVRAK